MNGILGGLAGQLNNPYGNQAASDLHRQIMEAQLIAQQAYPVRPKPNDGNLVLLLLGDPE